MQFLAFFDDYVEKMNDSYLSDHDLRDIREQINIADVDVSEVNIGPGADLITILVTINTIANVFLLGQHINTGFDGWVDLGKRLKSLFDKKQLIAIDRDTASLLAFEYINSIEVIQSLIKTHEHEINWINLDEMFGDRKPEDFISRPHAFFIQTYLINDEKYYVVSITAQGEVELIKRFDAVNPYGMYEIK
ncbi:MAG: hypothetical protein ACK4VI_09385 [Alphaproteobacteria bacterium]